MARRRRRVAELHRPPQEKKRWLLLCELLLRGKIQRNAGKPTEPDGTAAAAGVRR
jgi:hypothetical protein